jgi:purine-binding chemotaxis protein CheW
MGIDVWGQENEDGGDVYRGLFAITRSLDENQVVGQPNQLRFLHLKIGALAYLLESEKILEILMVPKLTFVPNGPTYAEGVMNLRGKIIPVINLKKMLGGLREQATASTRVLVCDSGDNAGPIAIIVDAVTGIISVTAADIDEQAQPAAETGLDLMSGVSKRDKHLVGILSVSKIISAAKSHSSAPGTQKVG